MKNFLSLSTVTVCSITGRSQEKESANGCQALPDLGIQSVVTSIDSNSSVRAGKDNLVFKDNKVVLLLHEEKEQGGLFKVPAW
jgi:uncharacterized protein YydD (DUF2326 family)